MPSLMRFLTVVVVLGAFVYAGMYVLANLVDPGTREITVTVPIDKARPPP